MKRIHWILLGIITVVSFVFEMTQEPHHWWERIPGFYIYFGFIGCVAIIVISKALGKLFIQKDEDYYDVR